MPYGSCGHLPSQAFSRENLSPGPCASVPLRGVSCHPQQTSLCAAPEFSLPPYLVWLHRLYGRCQPRMLSTGQWQLQDQALPPTLKHSLPSLPAVQSPALQISGRYGMPQASLHGPPLHEACRSDSLGLSTPFVCAMCLTCQQELFQVSDAALRCASSHYLQKCEQGSQA